MAEYWVSHIDLKDKHIRNVKAFINTVEGIKNPNIYPREEIVKSIDENDDNWYTCMLKDKVSGKRVWEKGAKIHTVDFEGEKFIRTDGNKQDSDNLGELPSIEKSQNINKSYSSENRDILDI